MDLSRPNRAKLLKDLTRLTHFSVKASTVHDHFYNKGVMGNLFFLVQLGHLPLLILIQHFEMSCHECLYTFGLLIYDDGGLLRIRCLYIIFCILITLRKMLIVSFLWLDWCNSLVSCSSAFGWLTFDTK